MDPLACLLDGARARRAFVLRASLTAPWSLRIEDHAPLTFVAVARGSAWLRPDAGPPRRLGLGDTAVLRGPDAYLISDTPARRAQVVIDEDQQCRPAPGSTATMGPQGIRAWGNSPDGETILLTGTYRTDPEASRHLLAALPAVLVLDRTDWDNPLAAYLAEQARRDAPGQEAVLDRLVDLLLVSMLRTWFERDDVRAPGWFRASGDPVVGGALALIHDHPAESWTIGTLAARLGTSRATLAKRFAELVGSTVIGYLTDFRLELAADLLADTDLTIEAVARRVGYSNAFALSAAFKRVRGSSPREHRLAMRA